MCLFSKLSLFSVGVCGILSGPRLVFISPRNEHAGRGKWDSRRPNILRQDNSCPSKPQTTNRKPQAARRKLSGTSSETVYWPMEETGVISVICCLAHTIDYMFLFMTPRESFACPAEMGKAMCLMPVCLLPSALWLA